MTSPIKRLRAATAPNCRFINRESVFVDRVITYVKNFDFKNREYVSEIDPQNWKYPVELDYVQLWNESGE